MTDKRVQQSSNPNEKNNWGWPPQTPTLNSGDILKLQPLAGMDVDATVDSSCQGDFDRPYEEDSNQVSFTHIGSTPKQYALAGSSDSIGRRMGPSDTTKLTISGGTITPDDPRGEPPK